jgi:isopenicillin N synthase-like dioxygenase
MSASPLTEDLTEQQHIPVIDFAALDSPGETGWIAHAELRHLLREYGFFYLQQHGIAAAQLAQAQALTREFFALPPAAKLALENIHSPQFRGYTRLGEEFTRSRRDWREQFDIGREEAALNAPTAPWQRLLGPNL